uniref:Rod shape-determining protein MreD n=1 Tax=uncultured Nocardioidaceae bacterium TaxID=253824 RepID=A0A6J4M1F9_9ACTN|nr:MAG: Rod shape-determining protein MreD [uncultured Nocardioidaceae bacterium]
MPLVRTALTAALVVLAVSLQAGLLSQIAIAGVVPDLVLLVVVAVAFVHGPTHGAVVGLLAGLTLDLAPPADHTAGRWALALVVVGYLAGMVRSDATGSAVAALMTVGACAFVGASVFALSGLVLVDPGVTVERVLEVLPVQVLYDLAVTVVVLPPVITLMRRLEPAQERWVHA